MCERSKFADVQSFLIDNKSAILSFLKNYDDSSESSSSMPRERSLSRSVSPSPSPVPSKSSKRVPITYDRSRSNSVDKERDSWKRSRVDSASPIRGRRHLSRSRSRSGTPAHSATRGGREYDHRPRRYDNERPGKPRFDRSNSFRDGGRPFHPHWSEGRELAEPSKCLGVFGMNVDTTEGNLDDIFSEFGRIDHIKVVRDHVTGRSRGFAFVYYDDIRDAVRAKRSMKDCSIDDMKVRVDFSLTDLSRRFGRDEHRERGGRGSSTKDSYRPRHHSNNTAGRVYRSGNRLSPSYS